MKNIIFLFIIVFIFVHNISSASLVQSSQPSIQSYELEVSFIPQESRMEGNAKLSFGKNVEELSELVFYLHGELSVESINMGKTFLSFTQDKVFYYYNYSLITTKVVIDLKDKMFDGELMVKYKGSFNPSKARSPSDYMRIDSNGVYLRSYAYSLWFPVFLESGEDSSRTSFTRVILHTPKDFTAVFVGERISDKLVGENRVSEWRALDIPIFAAQITAHRFVIYKNGNSFIYSRQGEQSRKTAPKISDFIAKLNKLMRTYYKSNAIGEQVHIVEMPRYGDISSNNFVGMASNEWKNFEKNEYAKETLAHEFVHPFVKLNTLKNDPLRALVIEGFPSYFHWPVLAELLGEDYYNEYMNRIQTQYIEKKKTGKGRRGSSLPEERPILLISEKEIGNYKDTFVLSDRVLLFFDYLRTKMGKDSFFKFSHELFSLEVLNLELLQKTISNYLSDIKDDLHVWLSTNDYPERFHRQETTN